MNNNFTKMHIDKKLEVLSDILADACFSVAAIPYQKLSSEQKEEVKRIFFGSLQKDEIVISEFVMEEAEIEFPQSPMGQMLREYNAGNSKYAETVSKLSEGRKVTIVKLTEFGFPYVLQTVIHSINLRSYAQHKDAMQIIHKPKRKRDLRQNWVYGDMEIVIYDGWQEIDIDAVTKNTLKETDSIKIVQGKYGCFDNRYLTDIIEAVGVKPLVKII